MLKLSCSGHVRSAVMKLVERFYLCLGAEDGGLATLRESDTNESPFLVCLVLRSPVDLHAGAVSTSLKTLLARIQVLRRFLQETKNGKIAQGQPSRGVNTMCCLYSYSISFT